MSRGSDLSLRVTGLFISLSPFLIEERSPSGEDTASLASERLAANAERRTSSRDFAGPFSLTSPPPPESLWRIRG